MNDSNSRTKTAWILPVVIIVLIAALIFISFKYIYYVDGNESGDLITGTYHNEDENDSPYMTINYDEHENSFCLFTDNKETASGKIEKKENCYELYEDGKLYGKVIPLYKRLYFVDKNLDVIEMPYYSDEVIMPANE